MSDEQMKKEEATKEEKDSSQVDSKKADKKSDKKADKKAVKKTDKKSEKKTEKSDKQSAKKESDTHKNVPEKKVEHTRQFAMSHVVVIALVAVLCGGLLGYFVVPMFMHAGASGKTTIADNAINNTVVGSYVYNGQKINLTAHDVMYYTTGINSQKMQDDKSYAMPAADNVLAEARAEIIIKEAEKQNITVSDEEVAQFAKDDLGSDDFQKLAENYQLDNADEAKAIARRAVLEQKLRDSVLKDQAPTRPETPTAAADGKDQEKTTQYGEYLVKILGQHWDTEKNTWKDTENNYYAALKDTNFDGKTASYEQARMAYYVATQEYIQKQQELSNKWTDYVNNLMSSCSIEISSLVSTPSSSSLKNASSLTM